MSKEIEVHQGNSLTANPFGSPNTPALSGTGGNALMTAESQRAIAEIQAMSIMALHNPRNPQIAMDKILIECQRPSLAECAVYSFPRGGQNVTGASIRLAEVIKRNWGHIRSGWRCLERAKGRSVIEAYAYDIQSNVGENRTFEVRHWRDTKQGGKAITDERDIYELEANQAARRVRACILALIDGDVIEAAIDQCTRTLETKVDVTPDGIKRMLEAFAPFKVNQKMLEARIGRNLSSITPAQMVGFKNILNGLKDGMSTVENWFDKSLQDESMTQETSEQPDLKKKIEQKKEKPAAPDPVTKEDIENATKSSPFDLEQMIRKALAEAKTKDEALLIVSETHADGLNIIKEKAAGSYQTLKVWIDQKINSLPQ